MVGPVQGKLLHNIISMLYYGTPKFTLHVKSRESSLITGRGGGGLHNGWGGGVASDFLPPQKGEVPKMF